jgi:hypothetical protein
VGGGGRGGGSGGGGGDSEFKKKALSQMVELRVALGAARLASLETAWRVIGNEHSTDVE